MPSSPLITSFSGPDPKPKSVESRIYYLDGLRALMMISVVFAHAAMSFAVKAPSGWAALDRSRSLVFDLVIFLIASFAMQLFFFLAGFFSILIIQKKGIMTFAISRWNRIIVPFLLAVVTVLPLLQIVGLYGTYKKSVVPQSEPFWTTVKNYFTNGIRFSELNLGHLWFLLYLTIVTVCFILTIVISRRLKINRLLDSSVKKLNASPAKPLLLAIPTAALMHLMNWMIDTPSRLLPEWHIVAYYVYFFFMGALYIRVKESFTQPQKYWKLYLILSLLVTSPATLGLIMKASYSPDMKTSSFYSWATLTCALSTWFMIFGIIGLSQRRLSKPTKALNYLSEASLWLYIIHFPIVLYLQVVVMHWQLPVLLKFLFVLIFSFVIMLGSYEFLVRRTFLGVILNGRKFAKSSRGNPDQTMLA